MELSVHSLLPSDNHSALLGLTECGSSLSLKKLEKYIFKFLFRKTLRSPIPLSPHLLPTIRKYYTLTAKYPLIFFL